MAKTRPVMKENFTSQAEFSQRVENALRQEAAFDKAELEYAKEINYFEPKYHGIDPGVVKRISQASQSSDQTWEQKGKEWQKARDEQIKTQEKRQKMLNKKANKWVEELYEDFGGGDYNYDAPEK